MACGLCGISTPDNIPVCYNCTMKLNAAWKQIRKVSYDKGICKNCNKPMDDHAMFEGISPVCVTKEAK